jgi:hypothetical protein
MKPKFLFFPLLFCLGLLALVSVSSCSKDDDSSSSSISESSLIGTWKISHTKGYEINSGKKDEWDVDVLADSYIYVFNSDGTYTNKEVSVEGTSTESGVWSLSGGNLLLSYIQGSFHYTDTIKVEKLTSSTLILFCSDSEYEEESTYLKVN